MDAEHASASVHLCPVYLFRLSLSLFVLMMACVGCVVCWSATAWSVVVYPLCALLARLHV